jgi:hypothetical protein
MFLQLVPAKAGESEAITTNTYAKATAFAANTQYYKKSSGAYTEVTIADANAFAAETDQLYIATTDIGIEIQASELGDVTMNNSTAAVDFATGTGSTSATIGFVLPAAEYTLKDDQFIDLSTTGSSLSSKYEMTTLGGVSGFTITGNMNKNTEWSQLKSDGAAVTTITVTPTYTITDATGQEEAISTGKYQVKTTPANAAPSIATTTYTMTSGQDVEITLNYGVGSLAATGVEKVTFVVNGETKTCSTDNYTVANGKLTFKGAYTSAMISNNVSSRAFTIVFNDTAKTSVTVTLATE